MALPLRTIAIADDEPGVRNVLTVALTDAGYRIVGVAENGRDAIDLVKAQKPNVLILDVHMPIMDGLSALPKILDFETTAVIVLTADLSSDIARQAMDRGACGYIQKPFEVDQLRSILESGWHLFQTVNNLKVQTKELTEALEVRKLLEKAKGILILQQGLSEEESHKTLQKMSQDQGISLKEVCRSVIQVQMVLGRGKPSFTRNYRTK